MRGNFERYAEKITQNVIALLNIWKILTRIKVIGGPLGLFYIR
jgi:hypothetical protein